MQQREVDLKLLPVGIQTFSDIINGDYLYIDKTEKIYQMIKDPKGVYFLSRPRRFGKSLLLSTLGEIFLGNKELFKDLWIYKSDYHWEKYSVIKIDFSEIKARSVDDLVRDINIILDQNAKKYGLTLELEGYYNRFKELIQKLSENNKVVILVDEYDKQLIDNIDNLALAKEFKEILKGFYTVIKASDQYIRFVLLTGVSKFSKMSVFSGLNNLKDITMSDNFSTLLGITQQELKRYFDPYIKILAEKYNIDAKEILEQIKKWYNGYRFSSENKTVYNPFSTLLLFDERKFKNYWFESATPSFLINLLKTSNYGYDLGDLVGKKYSQSAFGSYEIDNLDAVSLLFQTGYLTITDYERGFNFDEDLYTLDFPNKEVKTAFNNDLLESFLYLKTGGTTEYIRSIRDAIFQGDIDEMFEILKNFFSHIPYDLHIKQEKYYQTVFFAIFLLLGYYIEAECKTNKGRIDAVVRVETHGNASQHKNIIYIFEFKLDDTAENALKQIKEGEYYQKYMGSEKRKVKSEKRKVKSEKLDGALLSEKLKVKNEKDTLASDSSFKKRENKENVAGDNHQNQDDREGRPYNRQPETDNRQPTTHNLFLIGVEFSTKEKNVKDWIVQRIL